MSTPPVTFRCLFSHWDFRGGAAQLAGRMAVPETRVRQWFNRGYLEPYYWPDFIEALQWCFNITITLEDLIAASTARRDARIDGARRSAKKRAEAKVGHQDEPEQTEAA